jgi:hypothetical protein
MFCGVEYNYTVIMCGDKNSMSAKICRHTSSVIFPRVTQIGHMGRSQSRLIHLSAGHILSISKIGLIGVAQLLGAGRAMSSEENTVAFERKKHYFHTLDSGLGRDTPEMSLSPTATSPEEGPKRDGEASVAARKFKCNTEESACIRPPLLGGRNIVGTMVQA